MIECVRAPLLTPADRLLLIRRTWPGAAPYWVFPGGHVEQTRPGVVRRNVLQLRRGRHDHHPY
jgi:8-oxo-dGTP pyrophosphatase MutT (NUDIX family)